MTIISFCGIAILGYFTGFPRTVSGDVALFATFVIVFAVLGIIALDRQVKALTRAIEDVRTVVRGGKSLG